MAAGPGVLEPTRVRQRGDAVGAHAPAGPHACVGGVAGAGRRIDRVHGDFAAHVHPPRRHLTARSGHRGPLPLAAEVLGAYIF